MRTRAVRSFIVAVAILTVASAGSLVAQGAPTPGTAQPAPAVQPPTRSITNVTGQLYRAQNNNHYNVFLVTPEGVIMTDPINRDFARWLKNEIAQRFKVPVRYVLYSHSDWDHASGGAVFADTAEFVGHVAMLGRLAVPGGRPPLSAALQKVDANVNGVVERAEATAGQVANFEWLDANGDGLVTGAEAARGPVGDVYAPTRTFADRHVVTLGGKSVHLIPMGNAHTADGTAIYFPVERALFAVDVLGVRRLPMSISPQIGAWLDAYAVMMALDFDHALPGHALMGNKEDARMMQGYLADLATGVAAGIGAGRSLAEIQKTLTLDAYKGFERYDTHRTVHIAEVFATLRGTR